MSRLLLLLDHAPNRRLLREVLARRYQVLAEGSDLEDAFDLAVVDAPALQRLQDPLRARRRREAPLFLPLLLIAPARDRAALLPRLWEHVDEVIVPPVEKTELQARLEMLLRTRQLSLELEIRNRELRRRYEELTRLRAEAERRNAELMDLSEYRSQLLGMAAHDLRTPLGVIRGFSEFLLAERADRAGSFVEECAKILPRIHASSTFMLDLVEDLLDISAIETGRLHLDRRQVDLAALVAANVDLNRLLAERKQIDIALHIAAEMPRLHLDADKVEQVLNNLLSNAVKYSHANTRVEVRLQRRGGEVHLQVADQGQGIPADEIDKLFAPFQTTSVRATAGEKSVGLGLVIVRRIVEGHGGRIWVESQVGKGSTFHVLLPVSAEPGRGPEAPPPKGPRQQIFDREAALQRFGGDAQGLQRAGAAFARAWPERLEGVRRAIAEGRGRALQRAAYSLSTDLGQLSAGRALDLAVELEKKGRRADLQEAPALCRHLEEEVGRLLAALQP